MVAMMLLWNALLCSLFVNAYAAFLPSDLLCWTQQGSVVVGKWLYIDSGEIWPESANGGVVPMGFTLSIDLSTSWTTSNLVPIVTNHTTGYDMDTRNPTMWYDSISNTVYWYGGWPYYAGTKPAVWGFTPNDQGSVSWVMKFGGGITQMATGSSTFQGFTVPASALWASTPTAYYSLGGYMNSNADPALAGLGGYQPAMSGLVTFDFQHATWSNVSSAGYKPAGFAALGQALYVPIFGQKGIIVYIGGDAPTSQEWTEGASLMAMSEITIYDIQSGNFYQQQATGTDIPVSRVFFCAAGAGPADNSTWEIFIFGGIKGGRLDFGPVDPALAPELGAVYVLTLPAFEWIRVPGNVTQRSNHRCQLIGNRQMLSIGGFIDNNSALKDPWKNGMGIFDVTDLAWKFNYSSDAAPYTTSKLVSNYYSSAPNPYPATWSDPALKAIFETPATTGNGSSPAVSPSAGPTSNTGNGSTRTVSAGTIAGATIGGLFVILVIAILLFYRWKRIQKANQHLPLPQLEMDAGLVPELDGRRREVETDAQNGYRDQDNKAAVTRTPFYELQGS